MRAGIVVLLACAACAFAAPALAVDRSLGAGIPKPSTSGAPWTDAQIASLDANIGIALSGAKTLRGAHAGVYAIDARDGRVLFERNQDDAFQPASTFKLLVGSAALDKLGRAFRFRTEVVANGPIRDGELQGELILRGGGDPFLRAADVDAAAGAVANAGITRTTRETMVDDTHFETPDYLPGWNWDDLPYDYAPLVSALSFEENAVHVTVTPGAAVGEPAHLTAAPLGLVTTWMEGYALPADVRVRVMPGAVTGPAGSADTLHVQRGNDGSILLGGAIPLGAAPDTIDASVPSAAAYARDAFTVALERRRVQGPTLRFIRPGGDTYRFGGPLDPAATVVWSHDSEPLGDVLADMWWPSDNLAAELLLRQLGFAANGAPGTTANGIAFEKTWLKQLGIDTGAALSIDDGSGLSTYDRITPHDLVTILKHDWDGPNRELVLDDLPVAGVRGTLSSAFVGTAAEKRVFAKTGTLSHASALAGYVATAKHGTVIFAFLVDDWVGAAGDLRDLRGRILSQIAEL